MHFFASISRTIAEDLIYFKRKMYDTMHYSYKGSDVLANQPKGVEVSALKENPIVPKVIMPETETDCQRTP